MFRRINSLVLQLAILCLIPISPHLALADDEAEFAAIRKQVETYLSALNAGDDARLSSLWTDEGEFVDASGHKESAKDVIVRKYGDNNPTPPARLRVTEGQLRMIAPDVAILDGTTEFDDGPGHATVSHYSATWVKRDGVWLLDRLNESIPPSPARNSRLDDLSWMLGEFAGQADDGTNVVVVAILSPDGNYILRDFIVTLPDGAVHTLNQRITWDAMENGFRSWVFDSDGSYGEGAWKRHGSNWLVTNSGATQSGQAKTAVNLYTEIDDDSFTVDSVGAMVGDELRPAVKIKLTREPNLP